MKSTYNYTISLILLITITFNLNAQQDAVRSILLINNETSKEITVKEGKKIKLKSNELEFLYEKGKFTIPNYNEIEINNNVIPYEMVETVWIPNKGTKGLGTVIMIGGGVIAIAGLTADTEEVWGLNGSIALFGGVVALGGYLLSDIKKGYDLQNDWTLQIQ